MHELSIILPTYNEKENIEAMIPEIEGFLRSEKISGEIIIVDDSSPDGTAEIAKRLGRKYGNVRVIVKGRKEGIGAALRVGYNSARGKYMLSSDSDMSFKVEDMGRLIKKLEEGFDLVVGSRHMPEGGYMKPSMRIKLKGIVSLLGNRVVRLITGIGLHDFSANFRVVRMGVWRSIRTAENTNSILLEMIMKTAYKGYKIAEIPVTFEDRLYGESKLNLGLEAPKFFAKLLLFTVKFRVLRQLD